MTIAPKFSSNAPAAPNLGGGKTVDLQVGEADALAINGGVGVGSTDGARPQAHVIASARRMVTDRTERSRLT